MSDIFGPGFQPNPPAIETGNGKEPKKRGRKAGAKNAKKAGARKGRAPKQAQTVDTAVLVRRPRKARVTRIELGVALTALSGLTEDDAKFVLGIEQAMRAFSGKQRKRIALAISRLYT